MGWRQLSALEIEQLTKQQNSADDWNQVSVVGTFCLTHIRNCHFSGRVLLGENVSLYNVAWLANCQVGDNCFIRNAGEISFEGYQFDFPIEIRNEDGSHCVAAFPEMSIADAFLCSQYPSSHPIHYVGNSNGELCQAQYGFIGDHVSISNVRSIRNCFIEPYAHLSDCTQLEQVYIHSSQEEPTTIGAGVIARNAIFGLANLVDTNAIVRNVLTGSGVALSEGLRITHCVVGDNSHLSCCEVLFALIFPFHEQHHNNSFLIAGTLLGQSNIAAGATIGSNHNGRKNDCEMSAGRGFWPGLCTSIKFPSHFASYTLLAKGAYPYELKVSLPFSLLNNNVHDDALEIMPAFWWMYNCFALRRNAEKFQQRDHRKVYTQHIHYQPLAPDTVQEIITALNQFMIGEDAVLKGVERSRRTVRILKKDQAIAAYREMLLYYAYMTLHVDFEQEGQKLAETVKRAEHFTWSCVGGQLIPTRAVDELLSKPSPTWTEMHQRYDVLWNQYEEDNKSFACYVLKYLCDCKPSYEKIEMLMAQGREVVRDFNRRADAERERDLQSEFRRQIGR